MQASGLCSSHWRRQHPREGLLEFDRSRKMMSVAVASGSSRLLFVKGAPEAVVDACTSALDQTGPPHALLRAAHSAL